MSAVVHDTLYLSPVTGPLTVSLAKSVQLLLPLLWLMTISISTLVLWLWRVAIMLRNCDSVPKQVLCFSQ